MDGPRPHLLVGVDFGMTCTGVSYANLSIGSSNVRWIQKWPGRSQANENKVPTILVYPHHRPEPSSWGFISETAKEQNAEDKGSKDWFKTYLDPARLALAQRKDPTGTPRSIEEVEKYYIDYLRFLYRHIEFKLTPDIQGATWQNAIIEFIFSVPTTWNPEIVERFRSIVQQAGFGGWPSHLVTIGLTEAEAAAVHTSIEASAIFRERDVLLVCDAGGGTTDLSVLRVNDTTGEALSLEQLDEVYGDTIGSAAIDSDFEKLVMGRLEQADRANPLGVSPDDIAWEMMKGKDWQNTKCEHGGPNDTPLFSVPIPKLDSSYIDNSVGIENKEMRFSRDDLCRLFNNQIQKLIALIDSQLQSMQRKYPNEQVAHLVLSGGLGHSPYVQQHLRARYATGGGHYNAQTLQVRIAPDPQLAVCKGIVADRVRKLKAGKAVLRSRCCRASYGTLHKEEYDQSKPHHVGRPITVDPLNGKSYVTRSIDWFIKQGQPISSEEPLIHPYTRKIVPGDPRRTFPTTVVVSHAERESLPVCMGPNVEVLCEIESNLSAADENKFKKKNRHFWNTGKPYFRVEYQVRVLIGPADIRFELWFDDQKLSKDRPIKVEWTTTAAAPPEPPRPVWQTDDPVLNIPGHKSSMDLRGQYQRSSPSLVNQKSSPSLVNQRSSPNLVNHPYELGNRSPPSALGNFSSASSAPGPPVQNGLYPAGPNPNGSQVNIGYNNMNGGWQSNSSINTPDISGLQLQSPPVTSPAYPNGGASRSPPLHYSGLPNPSPSRSPPIHVSGPHPAYGYASPPPDQRSHLPGPRPAF